MAPGRYRFEGFLLDPHDRQLRLDDTRVELNARYLDALALLVSEQGRLVSKDRFLEEVWRGVPVTDEAIKRLNRNPVDRAFSKLINQMVKKVDGVSLAAILSAVTATDSAAAVWSTATAKQTPLLERDRARAYRPARQEHTAGPLASEMPHTDCGRTSDTHPHRLASEWETRSGARARRTAQMV